MSAGTRETPEVVIAVLNFNGRDLVLETIASALRMDYPAKRVLLVDDGSTDGSLAGVRQRFPDVRIVEMGANTKMLNRVRNTALEAAGADFVLLTDNDIRFEPDCLSRLFSVLRERPDAAVAIPRIMYRNEPDRIYIDRNRFHYVCASIDVQRGRRLSELRDGESNTVARSFGCGIHLIDLGRARPVGFFDADYPMGWGDDGEFHHRINLSGLTCYSVPDAVVYHEAIKGAPRIHGQIHNRLRMILETYAPRSLFVLWPALVLYDGCLFGFLLLKGLHGEYLRAVRDVFRARDRVREKRSRVQAGRRRGDRELFTSGPIYVPGTYATGAASAAIALLGGALNLYWRLVRRLLR